MKSPKTLVFLTLFTAMALSSCSGTKTACTSNCTGSGNGSVSVTMVADTLPANPSILSLQVTIIGITFTSSAGTNQSVTLNPAITLDLMRLQSDTAFLGTFANIPSGQYTSATLAFSNPAKITFLNDTTATLSGCAVSAICPLTSNTAAGTPVATVSFAVPQSGVTGIGIDLNFANAVSISGGNLVVNFSNNNVLSGFTLPRANSNLASGQLELIEDFTGVVSISGSSVTITSPTRGVLTATSTSNSFFDQSPPPTNLCPSAPNNCAVAGQIASVDAFLKSDGALELKEFEPLNATQQDFVEGTVYAVNSPTQFTIAVTDKVQAATTSLISGLNTSSTPRALLCRTRSAAVILSLPLRPPHPPYTRGRPWPSTCPLSLRQAGPPSLQPMPIPSSCAGRASAPMLYRPPLPPSISTRFPRISEFLPPLRKSSRPFSTALWVPMVLPI